MLDIYHSFPQIFQKKTESTRGIAHGVGTMKDHEGIERIIELNLGRDADPIYSKKVYLSDKKLKQVHSTLDFHVTAIQ
jgi:hypothetical protein